MEPSVRFLGHRGYVPAGKLQLYHPINPSEKEPRGQTGMPEDYRLPTPEPTQPSVPTVLTVSQVSLEEGRGLGFSSSVEACAPLSEGPPPCEARQ